jgi:hypothetical protein
MTQQEPAAPPPPSPADAPGREERAPYAKPVLRRLGLLRRLTRFSF